MNTVDDETIAIILNCFGLAFCEASGKCLVRWSGTDPAMIELAQQNARAVGAEMGGQVHNYLAGALSGLPFSATKIAINLVGTGPLFFPLCTFPGPEIPAQSE